MFKQMLDKCRERFNGTNPSLFGLFSSRRLPTYDAMDQVPDTMKPHYAALLDEGRVVWGARVQANFAAFEPGPDDMWGVTVYSPDRYYDDRPQDLVDVAHAVGEFKGTIPDEPTLRPVAAHITEERDASLRQTLPKCLTDGREVFIGATIFHRSRMPGGFIAARLYPVVIAPARTAAHMILPLPYWAEQLKAVWDHLDDALAKLPVQCTALEVARAASKSPVPDGPAWDVSIAPIWITPRAAEAFRATLRDSGARGVAYLSVELRPGPDGVLTSYTDLYTIFDPSRDMGFTSNGIRVRVPKDQIEELRGTTVDYVHSLFGTGFSVRHPDHPEW